MNTRSPSPARHGLLIAAVLASFAGALLAEKFTTRYSGRPPENVPVTYEFNRDWPAGHDTTRITLRSDRKPGGTLFVTGRNLTGTATIKFPALGVLKGLAGDPKLMGLLGKVEVTGQFTATASHYSAGRDGAGEFVASDWLRKGTPPVIAVAVKSVTNWKGHERPKGAPKDWAPPHKFTYRVRLAVDISADRRTVEAAIDDVIVGFDPATSETAPATVTFRGTCTVEGAKLGLKDDDAGPIEIGFVIVGFTKYAATDKDAVKTEKEAVQPKMELPDLPALPSLPGMDE